MTREEAIELLEDLDGAIEDNHGRDYDEAFRMAIEALQREDEFLKNLGSNEPQFYDEDDCWNGRVHGEWVTVNDVLDVYICDQCGEIYQIQNIPMWHFCPNCGADMRKENK